MNYNENDRTLMKFFSINNISIWTIIPNNDDEFRIIINKEDKCTRLSLENNKFIGDDEIGLSNDELESIYNELIMNDNWRKIVSYINWQIEMCIELRGHRKININTIPNYKNIGV